MCEQPASKISASLVIGYCYCGQWEPTPVAQTSLGAKSNGKTSPGKGDRPISKCRATPTTCTTLLARCGLWLFFCGSGSNNKSARGSPFFSPLQSSFLENHCLWGHCLEAAGAGKPGRTCCAVGVVGMSNGWELCTVGQALQLCWKPVIEYLYASWTHVSLLLLLFTFIENRNYKTVSTF